MNELLTVPHLRALPHMDRQRAGCVAALGAAYYRMGRTVLSDAHVPVYLRQTQAERERAEKLRQEAEEGADSTGSGPAAAEAEGGL